MRTKRIDIEQLDIRYLLGQWKNWNDHTFYFHIARFRGPCPPGVTDVCFGIGVTVAEAVSSLLVRASKQSGFDYRLKKGGFIWPNVKFCGPGVHGRV